ncbi:MAG TPA: protein-disulfide reductase DsbD domain-containing protein [Pyrinomonadaceae bacterium]|nr:protein-disulfide reductase DsbD domain-containing protein [Pyrinomonadaceae bacterium]
MWSRALFATWLLTAFCFSSVRSQDSEALDPIKWTIQSKAVKPAGDKNQFTLDLTAQIEGGWHLYSTEKVEGGPSPTRITILPGQSLELDGEIDSPAPRSAYDPNFQVATEFYEGSVVFTIPVKPITTTRPGKVRVQVRYQTCTPTICLPPKLIELETSLEEASSTAPDMTTEVESISRHLGVGSVVPDFQFTDFNGKARRFSEFRGRIVLLDFWASWCSPCLADIPQLKSAYQKYRMQGFEIIGMDSETLGQTEVDAEFVRESQAKAREIVRTRGANWAHANNDSSLPIAVGLFEIKTLPAKFLIDRSGKVVAQIKNVSELDDLLPRLISSQP